MKIFATVSVLASLLIGCQARLDLADHDKLIEIQASITEAQKANDMQFAMIQSQMDVIQNQINTNFYISIALFITLFLCFFTLMILLYVDKRNQNRFLQTMILKNSSENQTSLLKSN